MGTSEAVTDGIRIHVESSYVPERSDADSGEWFFAYQVRISNEGTQTAQLISRHWIITDGNGHVEEVKGPGVVGKQPSLAPGEAFEYTSFCPLPSPFGTMEGSYQMRRSDGTTFEADIAPFTLADPNAIH